MKIYVETPTIAKRNYCVPAVLQMVLEHYGIHDFSQELIASQLTMIPDNVEIDHMRWGAQIANDTLNVFFAHNNIKLSERYIPITHFIDEYFFEEEILNQLQKGVSLVCGFNYTWLYSNREDTYRHVSIIVDCNPATETVTLLDPGPKDAGYKKVLIDKLYQAIQAGKDGLWCISEIKE